MEGTSYRDKYWGMIANKFGHDWAHSRRFKTLDEVVSWVGNGIRASDLAVEEAKWKLVDLFLPGFNGFEKDGTAKVCLT